MRNTRKFVVRNMIEITTGSIKLLRFVLLLALVLTSACTTEDGTLYELQHGEHVAKVYGDMEEIGRINEKYAAGEVGYVEYATEITEALLAMEDHLLEFRRFLKENHNELTKAGINVTESEEWVETQLRLTGEIAAGVAGKLESRGYRGKMLSELRRLGEYAE